MPKQFSFVVEVAIKEDGDKVIIIREPRNGLIVKVTSSPEEITSFLEETIKEVIAPVVNSSKDVK